jgi:SAM-dependent methyltransferase
MTRWTTLLHRIASHPAAYDRIQRVAGVGIVHRHVAPWLRFTPGALVLDVGGGTGRLKTMMTGGVRHICLDLERPKLSRYVTTYRDARPLQADATALPVRDGTVDAVTLALVTHHLTDDQIEHVIDEAARVLGRDGVLLLYDAVWAPARRTGRFLWKHDRGRYPRTAEQIATALRRRFDITEAKQFGVFHAYTAFLCRPMTPTSTGHRTSPERVEAPR